MVCTISFSNQNFRVFHVNGKGPCLLIVTENHSRARNNGRSTDNVRTDCGFDRSNFRLAGHVERSKFNRIENEIKLRFLLFSCYLSSRCVLRNFDMKSCTPKLKCLVTKLARIADSTIDLTFLILVWEVIRITAGVLGSRSHTRNHYTCM